MLSVNKYDFYDRGIAIIGMAGRFPGSKTIDEYWNNLINKVEAITSFSDDILKQNGVSEELLYDTNYVKAKGVLDDIEYFDADFFGFLPIEAETMDPQHRLFLETSWEALENAGYDPACYDGKIGVFSGANMNEYESNNLFSNSDFLESINNYQLILGNEKDYLSTRVSYKLNLKGPSITVQTACSTALVAIHLACRSLTSNECDMALAGGVTVRIPHKSGYMYQEGGILSPDGHCRAFDKKACGTVYGSGGGVIILKRLKDALDDKDFIHAVICGSAINNDGAMKAGYTAPSIEGQETVIKEAIAAAGITPKDMAFIETHGTGTPIGDQIEISSLLKVLEPFHFEKKSFYLSSVKPNIGHIGAASGVAGIIKTALALKKKQLPPQLHFRRFHPDIDLEMNPLCINTEPLKLHTNNGLNYAGVSSFGIGGTNAHVIIGEAPAIDQSNCNNQPVVMIWSASSENSLAQATKKLEAFLKQNRQSNIADIAYTLQVGRRSFSHRRMLAVNSVNDAITKLEQIDSFAFHEKKPHGTTPQVAFIFPNSITSLINSVMRFPAFKSILKEVVNNLLGCIGFKHDDVIDFSAMDKGNEPIELSKIRLVIIQYCFAKLWMSWRIQPQVFICQGLGGYSAMLLSGMLTITEAVQSIQTSNNEAFFQRLRAYHEPDTQYIPLFMFNEGSFADDSDLFPVTSLFSENHNIQIEDVFNVLSQERNWLFLQIGTSSTQFNTIEALTNANVKSDDYFIMPDKGNDFDMHGFAQTTLGKLWLKGLDVDWKAFHKHNHYHRIPLPTYPFNRKYYWIDSVDSSNKALKHSNLIKKKNIADWFYYPSWKRTIPLNLSNETDSEINDTTVLIFANDNDISISIIEGLKEKYHDIIFVFAGHEFKNLDSTAFMVAYNDSKTYEQLFQQLKALKKIPSKIVHLWTLTGETSRLEDDDLIKLGFYSLFYLTQNLGRYYPAIPLVILTVTNDAVEFNKSVSIVPEKALLSGISKVISQEFQNITSRLVNISPQDEIKNKGTIRYLLDELAQTIKDPVVTYNQGYRWVQTYESVRLQASVTQPDITRPDLFRNNGTYILIGGLGGIGLVLAEFIAKTVNARIVLTSRTPLPEKSQWEDIINDEKTEGGLIRKLLGIKKIEEYGAKVYPCAVDATDFSQMENLFTQTYEHFGTPNGVIFLAGTASESMIMLKTVEDIERVLKPKIEGIRILDKLIRHLDLDFLLFCSSLAAIWGGVGQSDYASANSFMDAYANQLRRRRPTVAMSVNWDMWQEVGMGVHTKSGNKSDKHLDQRRKERLKDGILSSEGMLAFENVLHARLPQILVSTRDLESRIEQRQNELSHLENITFSKEREKQVNTRPDLLTDFQPPQNEIQKQVAQIWEIIFGIQPIGVQDDFIELGGHSLLATQLVNKLQKEFSTIELSLSDLFEQPTVKGISKIIAKNEKSIVHKENIPIKTVILNAFPSDRLPALIQYFKEKISKALPTHSGSISNDDVSTAAIDWDAVETNLIWDLKRDFNIAIYPSELRKHSNIRDLTRWFTDELEQVIGSKPFPVTNPINVMNTIKSAEDERSAQNIVKYQNTERKHKNRSICFILTSPRAGSTLFRLMLAGHVELFCPPELGILRFWDMGEWSCNRMLPFAREGIGTALMKLKNMNSEACKKIIEKMIQEQVPIFKVYEYLQELSSGKLIIDKTPRYALSKYTLNYAEEMFADVKYLHLIRHPYAVMESFVKNRFIKLFTDQPVNPYQFAEDIWTTYNTNILDFIKNIDQTRYQLIQFESLVTDPKGVMQSVSDFLDIPFEETLLNPYDGRKRMIDGPGDPNVFQHNQIKSNLSDAWKNIRIPIPISDRTRLLADHFGYKILNNKPRQTKSALVASTAESTVLAPLSCSQKRLWLFDQADHGNPTYNLINAYKLEGEIAVEALDKSLNKIIARHESLRTIFYESNHGPIQQIVASIRIESKIHDIQTLGAEKQIDFIDKFLLKEAHYRFRIDHGPLIRMHLIKINHQKQILVSNFSHICSDAWSLNIFRKELSFFYNSYVDGEPDSKLPELSLSYSVYSNWQRQWLQSRLFEQDLNYWRAKLAGPLQRLDLNFQRPCQKNPGYSGERLYFDIPTPIYKALNRLSKKSGCTTFVIITALLKILLSHWSGTEDIIVGIPVSGRFREELESLIGYFADFIALRTKMNSEMRFQEVLSVLKTEFLEADKHKNIPFEVLLDELEIKREPNKSAPVFQIAINMLNYDEFEPDLTGLSVQRMEIDKRMVEFNLVFFLLEKDNALSLILSYKTELFSTEIMKMVGSFILKALERVVEKPDLSIPQITNDIPKEFV